LYIEDGETLAQVAQRGGRCPVPGNVQGQVGRGSEQPDGVKMSRLTAGGWAGWHLKVPSNTIHSMVLHHPCFVITVKSAQRS